jgi:hypothetical protein
MARRELHSLRWLLAGWIFFAAFVALLWMVPADEASLLTRAVVFIGLIPPPVCFAAGIALAFKDEVRSTRAGAWGNVAAIFVHGILAIAVLQQFLP